MRTEDATVREAVSGADGFGASSAPNAAHEPGKKIHAPEADAPASIAAALRVTDTVCGSQTARSSRAAGEGRIEAGAEGAHQRWSNLPPYLSKKGKYPRW